MNGCYILIPGHSLVYPGLEVDFPISWYHKFGLKFISISSKSQLFGTLEEKVKDDLKDRYDLKDLQTQLKEYENYIPLKNETSISACTGRIISMS